MSTTMRAAVFQGKGKIGLREVPRPVPGVGQALIKVTMTTICGTDVHILKGEYPVREGLIVGHEPVGVIEELGPGVTGYRKGDRMIVSAITPCGQCRACLTGVASQCGHGGSGSEAIGRARPEPRSTVASAALVVPGLPRGPSSGPSCIQPSLSSGINSSTGWMPC